MLAASPLPIQHAGSSACREDVVAVQRFAGAVVPLHAQVANASPSTRISRAKRQSANVGEQNSVMRRNKYRRSSQLAKVGVEGSNLLSRSKVA